MELGNVQYAISKYSESGAYYIYNIHPITDNLVI